MVLQIGLNIRRRWLGYRLPVLALVIGFLLAGSLPVRAGDKAYFMDYYGVMLAEQAEELNQSLAEYSREQEIDYVVMFVDKTFSGSSSEYKSFTESYYLDGANGYRSSGMMMLVDMYNRKIDIRAFGLAKKVFEDGGSNVQKVIEAVGKKLRDLDYIGAVDEFIRRGNRLYRKYNGTLGERIQSLAISMEILTAALVIAATATIIAFGMHNRYKTTSGLHYEKPGSFQIQYQKDDFMYNNIVHRRIQRSRSSGGSDSGSSSGGTGSF